MWYHIHLRTINRPTHCTEELLLPSATFHLHGIRKTAIYNYFCEFNLLRCDYVIPLNKFAAALASLHAQVYQSTLHYSLHCLEFADIRGPENSNIFRLIENNTARFAILRHCYHKIFRYVHRSYLVAFTGAQI